MFTVAHLSDPHVGPLPAVPAAAFASKRVLGFLSWQWRRRHVHRREALDRLSADLCEQRPDHVVVTGDITNLSLPEEYALAADWLSGLGDGERVTVIAGNHDAYVAGALEKSIARWSEWMTDDQGRPHSGLFVRTRGRIALVCVSTAVATKPGFASGWVGDAQLAELDRVLADLAARDLFRLVLIHHPPDPEATRWRKRLEDGDAFREVVGRHGAELVLHGHSHRNEVSAVCGDGEPIPVVGVASASVDPANGEIPSAAYNLYRIDGGPGRWRCTMERRELTAEHTVEPVERRTLLPATDERGALTGE